MKKVYEIYGTIVVITDPSQLKNAIDGGGKEIPLDIFKGREAEADVENTTVSSSGKWKFSATKADKKLADYNAHVKKKTEEYTVELSVKLDKAIVLGFDDVAKDLQVSSLRDT